VTIGDKEVPGQTGICTYIVGMSDLPAPDAVPDPLRASAFEAKHMIRDRLRDMGYRNQLMAHTVAFDGVIGATVFIAIYEWSGTTEEWDGMSGYALDHGFCIERAQH